MPTCLQWPVASAPPPADGPLPNVPTLILSGEDDMRTPTSDARLIAARIPDAQLLVVPHTGHSVLGSDLSSCSSNAVTAFFAGHDGDAQCPNEPDLFKPTPIPPLHLGDVPPTPGLSGRAGRTVTAVLDSLVDLRREIIGAILNADAALPSGARFGGLRGGDAALTSSSVVLHALAYVPGVTLTGHVSTAAAHAWLGLVGSHQGRRQRRGRRGRDARVGPPRPGDARRAPLQRHACGHGRRRQRLAHAIAGRPRDHPVIRRAPALGWRAVPNALAAETSPYLRQHRDNPVIGCPGARRPWPGRGRRTARCSSRSATRPATGAM